MSLSNGNPQRYQPGERITVGGRPFIVVGVRKYLAAAKKLAAEHKAVWSIFGCLYVVMKPAESVSPREMLDIKGFVDNYPQPPGHGDHPAMREAMA